MAGFVPIPGSDAEAAVNEIRNIPNLTIDNFDEMVAPIWEKYNIDPVTAEAVSETAHNVMSRNPKANMDTVAEDLVGRTVADPSVAGNNAREAVHRGSEGLKPSEQNQLAVKAAGDAAEKAGGDRATAESKAQEAIDKGASPEMAAESAATAATAEALVKNSASFADVSGFDIMGYLKAMVQGVVIETNLGTETHTVKGETWWNIDGSFVQTTANELTINCNKYHAEADTDIAESPVSMNFYLQGYKMTSPNPFTFSGLSLAGNGATTSGYINVTSLGFIKTTVATRDVYLVGAVMGSVEDQFERSSKALENALVRVHVAGLLNFLGGNPSPVVKKAGSQVGSFVKGMFTKKKSKGP